MFEYFNKDFSYTSLCLVEAAQVLLCGTSRGSVCIHLWPPMFTDKELLDYPNTKVFREIEFAEFQPQLFPITLMAVTPKVDSLITVSSDGMVFIHNLEMLDRREKSEQKSLQIADGEDLSQVINELFLVKNSYIKQQARAIRDKEMEVARYEKKKITDAENKHREHRGKMAKIEKLFETSKQSSLDHQTRFMGLSQETINKQNHVREQLAGELQVKQQTLDSGTHKMVSYEQRRNQALRDKFAGLVEDKKLLLEKLAQDQLEMQSKLTGQFNDSLRDLRHKYQTILEDSGKYGDEFLKKIGLQENEYERELHRIEGRLNEAINVATKTNKEIQDSNDHQSKKNDDDSKRDVKKQQEFEEEFILNTKYQERKVKIVVDLLKIQEQLLEREQVVFSKDETIKMARDEQINLENFQFMLDQKIKSLKSNKSKLNEEIDSREKILRDMFNELIKQSQTNNLLNKDIKDRMQKIGILNEQMKNIDLRIYFWAVKIKDYHRKITAKINTTKKNSEVKMLVNKLISDSNVEQKKNPERLVDKEQVLGIANASSDVGTSVHKELIEQNMWLIKKLNMSDQAAENIKKIREENIDTGLSQNKKLIEECNKLNVDNDMLYKKHAHYEKIIEGVKKRKEELQRSMNLQKVTRDSTNPKMAASGLLPKIVRHHDQENSLSKHSESNLYKSGNLQSGSNLSVKKEFRSSSHVVMKKKPTVPARH
jgi:hypothetical protein